MSRRRPNRNQSSNGAGTAHSPFDAAPIIARSRATWLNRLLTRASSAGLSGLGGGRYGVESLEARRLLTTFVAAAGQTLEYEYEAEGGGVMRLAYHDVTFEAIGVAVDPKTDAISIGNLVPGSVSAPSAPRLAFNLFTIYVTQSSADSWITDAPVARLTVTPPPGIRADLPFGAGQTIAVSPANGLGLRYTVVPGNNIGAGVLGAFTLAGKTVTGLDADTPIDAVPDDVPLDTTGLGVYPANAFGDHNLHAGFYVPNNAQTGLPQDINTFKFAGEVFGNVAISGNIQLFYAGALLTGQAAGAPLGQGAASTPIYNPSLENPIISAPGAPNFTVGGDLHDLITSGDVGGDIGDSATDNNTDTGDAPNYNTGFYGVVDGKIGEIKDLNGGFYGHMTVTHDPNNIGLSDAVPEQEIEYKDTDVFLIGDPGGIGQIFEGVNGFLPTLLPSQLPAPYFNDTPDTAQYVGTSQEVDLNDNLIFNDIGGRTYDTEVTGTLQNAATQNFKTGDPADWYAMTMLGGTVLTARVTGGFAADIIVEVEDAQGRIIASDAKDTTNGTIQVKIDQPGIYKIGLLQNGTAAQGVDATYLLQLTGTGDLGLGAIVAGQEVSDMGIDGFLTITNGDFGGIFADGSVLSTTAGPTPNTLPGAPLFAPSSIIVARGNLRVVIGSSIGTINGNNIGDFPYLSVPNGIVGLIQSTDPVVGVLAIETQFDPNYLTEGIFRTDDQYAHAVGSIQVIDAATTFFGEIGTDAGIGTIHAQDMATTTPSYIDVNADNANFDGIIDLIDVTGNITKTLGFGVIGGGPEFVTHDGGNIRYLDIPAGVPIFLPSAFGGLADTAVTYAAGAAQQFTDDSGATYSVYANGVLSVTNVTNASTGVVTTVTTGPQFSSVTYPVLDKAGLIPISITSTGSLTVNATSSSGPNSSLDIGSVAFTGVGRAIVASANVSGGVLTGGLDANGNPTLTQPVPANGSPGVTSDPLTDATDEFLSLTGNTKVDVLNVAASTTVAGNSPVEISDTTLGEVVSIYTPGIGSIVVNGNLGFATPVATAASVEPRIVIVDGNTYPFVNQHTGVDIAEAPLFGFVIGSGAPGVQGTSIDGTASAVSIQAGGALGNIEAQGTIQSIVAGAHAITGQYNGIVGPIVAFRLMSVSVGQGLLPSDSGAVGTAGLYAKGKIGTVLGAGDIRGNIYSNEEDPFTDDGIDSISISNASIIGSHIGTVAEDAANDGNFITTSAFYTGAFLFTSNNENFGPGEPSYTYDIGPIRVSGLGGIIGTTVVTGSIASITVTNGGFGIFSSSFTGDASGRIGGISASGYGIRQTEVLDVGFLGAVTATGNGSLIPVTRYPIDLRPSDVPYSIEPFFGLAPDVDVDLNAVLGTSAKAPNIPNVTDTGVIEDDIFNGSRDFTSLTAIKARTAHPIFIAGLLNPSPAVADIPIIGNVFSNSINFGGVMGKINIKEVTDGFQITVGQLGSISLGNDVNRVGISVAGNLKSLVVNGNLGQYIKDPLTGTLVPDSYVNAGGTNGTITSIKVYGNMNANIYATGSIGSILITKDLLGGVLAYGHTSGQALGSLRVLGGIRDGSLVLNGNVGSIIVSGTLGTSAGTLNIVGSIGLISVGANHRARGSALALALTVNGTIGKLLVNGKITGSVHTIGDITNLNVTGDGTTANIITGALKVDGRIGTATISNGNIASNIIASGSISNFTLNRGSVLFGATVESQIDSIHNFKIAGGLQYGLYGSLLAGAGLNDNIDISGNVGDTLDAAVITADSGNTFRIRGTIQNHTSISLTFGLNLLEVDGNIAAGAVISAHPLKTLRVKGTNAGSITVV